jgi:hypothetical protein
MIRKQHFKMGPMHLVLTVPHPEGKYNDQEFYMKSMNEAFAKLRKTENWLQYIEGGEYGFEIKKSQQGNGLYIHVHSLCFRLNRRIFFGHGKAEVNRLFN